MILASNIPLSQSSCVRLVLHSGLLVIRWRAWRMALSILAGVRSLPEGKFEPKSPGGTCGWRHANVPRTFSLPGSPGVVSCCSSGAHPPRLFSAGGWLKAWALTTSSGDLGSHLTQGFLTRPSTFLFHHSAPSRKDAQEGGIWIPCWSMASWVAQGKSISSW